MNRGAKIDLKQDDLPLSSIAAHKLFPGRTTLYVAEVARALEIAENTVINLIEAAELGAVNIATDAQKSKLPPGIKPPRSYWRIPVSAFDAFVAQRKSL